MTESERILQTEYSEEFDRIRKNAMVVSFYKYGPVKQNTTLKTEDVIASLEKRLKKYKETGNTEYLADVANFAMMEYMYPQHLNGHYRPTDGRESPGIVGMSVKEIEEFVKNGVE